MGPVHRPSAARARRAAGVAGADRDNDGDRGDDSFPVDATTPLCGRHASASWLDSLTVRSVSRAMTTATISRNPGASRLPVAEMSQVAR